MDEIRSVNGTIQSISQGIREKIDNLTLQIVLSKFVDKIKLKHGELIEINLGSCPFSEKQRICVEDTNGRDLELELCLFVPSRSDETIIAYRTEDTGNEMLCLKSEVETLIIQAK